MAKLINDPHVDLLLTTKEGEKILLAENEIRKITFIPRESAVEIMFMFLNDPLRINNISDDVYNTLISWTQNTEFEVGLDAF